MKKTPSYTKHFGGVWQYTRRAGCLDQFSDNSSGDFSLVGCLRLVLLSTVRANMDSDLVKYTGGCHCGAVRYEVWAPAVLNVIDCNCSICVKKQGRHFIVPLNQFKLLKGHDSLKTYSFNTHMAKHNFCITCGIHPFYIPRSNPDGYGVILSSLDDVTLKKVKMEKFDGKNWESAMQKNSHISGYSKPGKK
nr:centromere protein V-like isoform X1 [Penaeus vannamei]